MIPPQGFYLNQGSVVAGQKYACIRFGHVSYYADAFQVFYFLEIVHADGKQQLVIFATVHSSSYRLYVKFFGSGHRHGIERDFIFIYSAPQPRIFAQVKHFRSQAVGNVDHSCRFNTHCFQQFNYICPGFGFKLAFQDIVEPCQIGLHARIGFKNFLFALQQH